jgi:hypothetical protein
MLCDMDQGTSALERAFQLAMSGNYTSVADIKKRLIQERYSVAQISGGQLAKQLGALIKAAREKPMPKGPLLTG